MMSRYLKAPPFEYIATIVHVQLGIVLSLAVLTLTLLIYRNWAKRRNIAIKEYYADALMTEVMNYIELQRSIPAFEDPRWYQMAQAHAAKGDP